MSIFKMLFAATALFNVALSSTAFSSETPSVVTSVQLVTSVTFVSGLPTKPSTTCATTTVTEVAPPTTVTVVVSPPVSSGAAPKPSTALTSLHKSDSTSTVTATTNKTQTLTHTSSEGPHHTTSVLVPLNSTAIVSRSMLSFSHTNFHNSTTATPTGTGHASVSASYSPPPVFTDTADVTNVGAAALAGGVFMALFGFYM